MRQRRWVQVTGASTLAFLVGMGLGGTSTEGMVTTDKAQALVDKAAQQAHDDATEAAERDVLESPEVVAALEEERAKVAEAQTKLETAQGKVRTLTQQRDEAKAAAEQPRPLAQPAPAPQPPPPPVGGTTDPRFDTCGEANDHGYGPYQQGVDPEYDWYDDRDDDGDVCET